MLIYIVVCLSIIVYLDSLYAEPSRKTFLKGSTDYKVEYSVGDNDTEMISNDQLVPFKIEDKVNKFKELNKMCKEQYYKTIQSKSLARKYYRHIKEPELIKTAAKRSKTATALHSLSSSHSLYRRALDLKEEPDYNYNDFLYEYYSETEEDEKSEEIYNDVKAETMRTGLMQLIKKSLKLNLEVGQSKKRLTRAVVERFWKISQIWLLIYIIVAIPLWCTIGWCCCCLCCKCCKPHATIDKAKRYMLLNPPGVLRDGSTDIVYEPSNKEIEAYEELDHLIKTL